MLIRSSRSSFLLLFYQAAARERNMLLAEPPGSAIAPRMGTAALSLAIWHKPWAACPHSRPCPQHEGDKLCRGGAAAVPEAAVGAACPLLCQ